MHKATTVHVNAEISISKGNQKTGSIPSFSLPSGRTCSAEACKHCYQDGCYARKIERLRSTVRESYKRNLTLVQNSPADAEYQLNYFFDHVNAPRLFRIHISGDFFNADYLEMWLRVIARHPRTQFLAFTKQSDVIRPYLDRLPANFSLVWSAWPGVPVPRDIRKALPVAWMQDGTEKRITKKAMECPGNCETCTRCWALSGNDVVFHKH